MIDRQKRGPAPFIFVFVAFMGFAALMNNLGKPDVQALRAVDLVGLLASGMCFGAAMLGLGLVLRGRI